MARDAAAQAAAEVVLIAVRDDHTVDAPGLEWTDAVAGDTPLPPAAPDGAELWIYTGGTTGRPKAVRWDEQDMFEVQMFATYSLSGLPAPDTMEEACASRATPPPRTW